MRAEGTPERAVGEKRYLKSDLEFYGATMPSIRRVVRETLRGQNLGHNDVRAIAEQLWSVPVHERRQAAVEVLEAEVAMLTRAALPLIERLIREARTWALVDPLAASITGVVLLSDPAATKAIERWVGDDDFWVRRAAMLTLLPGIRAATPDLARVQRFGDALLDETEFFIRKAVGWVLREVAKRDPAWVAAYVEPRLGRMSGVTFREAVKPLDPQTRDRLAAARRG